VAYFAEPMVNYRIHPLSMTNSLTNERFAIRFQDGLRVLWRLKNAAQELGYVNIVKKCRIRLAYQYAHNIVGRKLGTSTYSMGLGEMEQSILRNMKRR
jgi:hypothetical protein